VFLNATGNETAGSPDLMQATGGFSMRSRITFMERIEPLHGQNGR